MPAESSSLSVLELSSKLMSLRDIKPTGAVIQAVNDNGQVLLHLDLPTLPEAVAVAGCLNGDSFPTDLRGILPVSCSEVSVEDIESAMNGLNEYLLDTSWHLSFIRHSLSGYLEKQGTEHVTHVNGLTTVKLPMRLYVPRFKFIGVTSPVPLGSVLSEAILHNLLRECRT